MGLEPSCLLGFRDEIPAADEDRASPKSPRDTRHAASRNSSPASRQPVRSICRSASLPQRALLHGHCHQKSFGAMGAVERVLEAGAGARRSRPSSRAAAAWPARSATRPTPSTSRSQMGELSLLPAVRKAPGRCDHRGRRHVLPAPDQGRHRTRRDPCGAGAVAMSLARAH